MSILRSFCIRPICLTTFLALTVLAGNARAVGFQPITPDELKMTSEPKAPGAAAIILYREVDRDDNSHTGHEDNYVRVKIFTEEGRKQGDIEIPFVKEVGNIVNIHARTIEPDGSIVNFSGQVFDKSIVKARGVKVLAKTFSLPDVQVGSILEYYYTFDLAEDVVFDSHWIISDELFTRSAKFSLKPYAGPTVVPLHMRWSWHALPPGGSQPAEGPDKVIRLEVVDVPAFQEEDYMPPENEMKSRVDFIYSEEPFESEPDIYWKKLGKKRDGWMENFINKRKGMEEALGQIISPGDAPEVKLQKIYARVQQIRNTYYEQEKSAQEEKRAKEKYPENVEDVWKKQYGDKWQLTWLFVALARAAGFQADGVWVADRRNYFFAPKIMDGRRLDFAVAEVKVNGKDMFFDPGAEFTPYGLLPWAETGVPGLKLDKDGGSWLETTLPASAESAVHRKAELKLSDQGDLEGELTVTYTGLEASQRRLEYRLSDDTERKKALEDEVKGSIPAACEVELTNHPDWKSSSQTLVAEFKLKVPGWVSGAGRRALLPVGLFGGSERHLFDHADRVQPVYFEYPFQRVDDVSIDLPLGWQISSLPKPQKTEGHIVGYTLAAENEKGTLHLNRTLNVDFLLLDTKYYGALRNFFQVVRSSDEEQVVLQPGGTTAAN